MWLIVVWQFAQMTADVSWKSTRPVPPLSMVVAIDLNGHTPVYGDVPPTLVGVSETSAGNFTQSKVSWTHRTRRNAKFEKNCFITPGLVSTPAFGPPLVHSAGVNTPVLSSNVGQLPLDAVNRSVYAPLLTESSAANAGAVS